MMLSDLFNGFNFTFVQGFDVDISSVEYDSRRVCPGSVFVCITGFNTDGHFYVSDAIANGAVAVVCSKDISVPSGVCVIRVLNTRLALAHLSANFYGNPSSFLNVCGITGTNGKTTTSFFIESILKESGRKVGLMGTIHNKIADLVLEAVRTTPESLELQSLLRQMLSAGVGDVVMEVSSHSLTLGRVDCVNFDVGVFTNLTQDHLDFHESMQDYLLAKSSLFKMCRVGVVNCDDPSAGFIINNALCDILTFGIDNDADLQAKNIALSADGVEFTVEINGTVEQFILSTPGRFTVYNALAAIGAALSLGIDVTYIKEGLRKNQGVPGRFQTIKSPSGFSVIVDYAHTPDGLLNILNGVKQFVKNDVITVFGCGGDRDRAKRPLMGEIAGNLSDFCLITSDNPRSEDPELILNDIEVGMLLTKCPYMKIVDRREAIKHAVNMAECGDVVVIAGKGHENYQIFKDRTVHFDDVEIVRTLL